jgi:hypothetical protein
MCIRRAIVSDAATLKQASACRRIIQPCVAG